MIKILFYLDRLAYRGNMGGAEKVLVNLVNSMDKEQFDVTVQTIFPDAFSDRLDQGVRFKTCFSRKNWLTSLLNRLETALGMLYSLHIRDDYDIECAYLECGPTKVIASSTNQKAKKLAWVHCDFSVAASAAFAKKTAGQYAKFDRVVCVSEKCRDSYLKLFGHPEKAAVLHNVINDGEILEKSAASLPDGVSRRKMTICAVGNFTAAKNYPRLLRACAILRDEGFDFDLWILGDGDQRGLIEQTIRQLSLESRVTLHGFQHNPYPFMRVADVLVCSSNYEGFSTFVAEGLILGQPIVTTDCSGMQELLGNSEFGLITENSESGVYDGLKRMLTDEKLRRHYAERAAERGRTFSAGQLTRRTEEYFLSLLNGSAEKK